MDSKFTWSWHFANGNSIWERLDKGMVTNNWFLKFSSSWVHYLRCDSSDHCPFHVTLEAINPPSNKKLFMFEEMWLSNAGCEEVVQAAWNRTNGAGIETNLVAKVEKCGKDLVELKCFWECEKGT